ncbi:GDSL-type esterase/lipase family protein [Corynebacterium lowii]|uniref:Uncharacterized protein n=1 Tax=Corynebacterium lowii TaxID=1544413 RepID=A0A0Q0U2M9_9CORY|nr:GDSL-type esterase/lipase family protein [Corynebacterium lowii]KQB86128.1 hypothetical protein Clow_01481 [Corynebacterium lowii]MDP9852601.1 hypothetical protein [Corynebacterium lowii]
MKKLSSSMKAAALTAASIMALSLGTPAAGAAPVPPLSSSPSAQDNHGHELVVFGDSFTAHAGKNGDRWLEPARAPHIPSCATDKENWPKLIGQQTGKSVADWSCNGTGRIPVVDLVNYVESAISRGDLGPGTQDVAIMYGGMTPLQWADVPVEAVTPHGVDFTAFRTEMRAIKERIRAVAPNARVTMLSYPEMLSGDFFCPANMGSAQASYPIPGGKLLQETMRDNIRSTAGSIGANFIDVYRPPWGMACATRTPRSAGWWVSWMIPRTPCPCTPPMRDSAAWLTSFPPRCTDRCCTDRQQGVNSKVKWQGIRSFAGQEVA